MRIGIILISTFLTLTFGKNLKSQSDLEIEGKITISDSTNIFIGKNTGSIIAPTGNYNVIIGEDAGENVTTGDNNTIVGTLAGNDNSTGSHNSLFGYRAGFRVGQSNVNCFSNSFFGKDSGLNNSRGNRNSFFGQGTGQYNTTGDDNTFIGFQAGQVSDSGDKNTVIGSYAELSDTDTEQEVVIGSGAVGNGDSTVTLGVAGTTAVYMGSDGMAMVVSTSDRRFKEEIENSDLGLEFINALRPVTYYYKENKAKGLHHGLIAQEVKAVMDQQSVEWQGWHFNKDIDKQGLNYASLVVPLIKAIQELSHDNNDLKTMVISQQYSIQRLLTDDDQGQMKESPSSLNE